MVFDEKLILKYIKKYNAYYKDFLYWFTQMLPLLCAYYRESHYTLEVTNLHSKYVKLKVNNKIK
jgi:hypothetical protein